MISLVKKLWSRQIIRFAVVGCFNTVLDFTILNILVGIIRLPMLLSNTVSVTVCISVSYLLNHYIVFRQSQKPSLQNYAKFFAITGISVILVQNTVLYIIDHSFTMKPGQGLTVLGHFVLGKTIELNAAKVAAVLFGMAWNFLLYKYVVFKTKDSTSSESEEMLAL